MIFASFSKRQEQVPLTHAQRQSKLHQCAGAVGSPSVQSTPAALLVPMAWARLGFAAPLPLPRPLLRGCGLPW